MPKRKVKVEAATGPTQIELGQLISASIKINGNAIVATLLENSETLELSKENMHTVMNLVNACTERNVNAALQQLIKYY